MIAWCYTNQTCRVIIEGLHVEVSIVMHLVSAIAYLQGQCWRWSTRKDGRRRFKKKNKHHSRHWMWISDIWHFFGEIKPQGLLTEWMLYTGRLSIDEQKMNFQEHCVGFSNICCCCRFISPPWSKSLVYYSYHCSYKHIELVNREL